MNNILMKRVGANIKSRHKDTFAGSDGTGNDGDNNRIFTIITSDSVDIVDIFLDGVLLTDSQVTINNSLKEVTILINVFNSQSIVIFYNA